MRSVTVFFVVLTLCFPLMMEAAFIEPGLEDQLWSARPDDRFSVILKLYNPRDIFALDQELHARRAKLAERHITVIDALKANAQDTQGPVIAAIEAWKTAGQVDGYTAYWIENLIVVKGSAEAIMALAADRAVQSIGPNFKAELIEPVRGPLRVYHPSGLDTELLTTGQNAIRATQVNRELGITGEGVLVANCDTGVEGTHPALASRWRGLHAPVAECWLDLLGGSPNFPTDTYFLRHGSHVMGTICGRAINGNDTVTVGSAPRAEWIATNPINQGTGPGFNQDILDAFQWFADPDGDPNTLEDVPDVIQNSWGINGSFPGYITCFADWNTAITNCEAAGPVVTWSAGNEGPGAQTLRAPANFQFTPTQIFAVGAVDAHNDLTPPYNIASFSSRGPTPCQPNPNAIKPEIAAPGVSVYSCAANGGYQYMDGTSMAGPHVAGVVALMREACPDCDPQTIKEAIMATAIDNGYPPNGEDNTFGAGFIDAYEAVLAVFALGRIDGLVTSGGNPLSGVRVESLSSGTIVLSNAAGYYNLGVSEGTHTIRYSKFGYQTITVPNVVVVQGDTLHMNQSMSTVPSGVLAGTVMMQTGTPVQGAKVKIQGTPIDTLISDVNGRIYVTLPATTYGVYLRISVATTPPRVYTNTVDVTVLPNDTTFANLEIFVDLVEPSGPDAYGYAAYDRYDRDLPATPDWVELNPEEDPENPGTAFLFSHHDSSAFFYAPFTIGFYGMDSDCLTVNPNGWMLPGWVRGPSAQNTMIPSDNNDPPGIIAAVWDDMRIGLGAQQFHWYDQENGRWIFEFIDQRIVTPQNKFFDWQVHFLDPAHHPTVTGDAEIMVIYHRLDYLAGSTIGIESPSETMGLQLRFNTTVDSLLWPLDSTSAVRYTTGRPTATGTIAGSLLLHPASNEITSAVIRGGGVQTNPAANGQFTLPGAASAMASIFVSIDGYEAGRLNRVRVGADSTTNVTLHAWRLDPARDLWATQFNGEITLRWRQPLSVESEPYLGGMHYNVYADGVLSEGGLADTVFYDVRGDGETVTYTVEAVYRYGRAPLSTPLEVIIDLAAGDPNTALPTTYQLYQNYPNPFNPSTSVRLDVPERAEATLMVYDITGRLVRTLHQGTLNAGRYTFSWDSRDDHGRTVATGMYLCRFASDNYVATQKMLLMK